MIPIQPWEQEMQEIPDMIFTAVMNLPSIKFERIIRNLSQLGEYVTIACNEEGVTFSTASKIGAANFKLARTTTSGKEAEVVTTEIQEAVTLTFECKYLKMLTKANCLSSQVILSMGADAALKVEYKMEETVHARYYLAPKSDDNE